MPLEDYIIHVFCLIDDFYKAVQQDHKIRKSGFAPLLKDSELISMLIVGEFIGIHDNKKIWLEFKSNYVHLFPKLNAVKYKIFNKQATNLWHIIRIIHSKLLDKIGNWNLYLADGFPVSVCHYARANRSTLFGDKVSFGYCSAKKEKYYGFKVLLITTEHGIPVDYVIDAANIDERELLLKANIPSGSVAIADKGFIGHEFSNNLRQSSGVEIITPKRSNMFEQLPKYITKTICKIRKRIETVISQLVNTFDITTIKSRSFHGFLGKINRKILAYTTALYFNYQIVKDQFTQLELLIQA